MKQSIVRSILIILLLAIAGLVMIAWEVAEIAVAHQSSVLQMVYIAAGLVVIALAEYLWTAEVRGRQLKHKATRSALLVIEGFIGVTALAGGIGLVTGAFAQVLPVAWLDGTLFSDYTIPGLLLMIVVGGSALLAAVTAFIDHEWAVLVSVVAGLLMAGYEVVEIVSLDSKVGNALPMVLGLQLLYFVLGLAVFGLAGSLWMGDYRARHFHLGHVSHA